jgi:hypothetical protein
MYLSKEKHLCWKVENLAHCFPVRMELLFEMNTVFPSGFSRARNTHFVPKRPIQLSWRNTCISQKKSIYVRRCRIQHIFFPVRIELVLKGMLPTHQGFQWWEMLILFQIDIFSWIVETHIYLERKLSKLEVEASSLLLSCENLVTFRKGYCLPFRVFKGEKQSLCSKWAYSAELK